MILAIYKWPPGGAGVVLTSKTSSFQWILVIFEQFVDEFWNFERTLWHWNSMFGRSLRCQICLPRNLSKPHETSQKHSKTLKNSYETSQKSKFLNSFAKNANILLKYEKKESQQHPVFPGGHPSKYWLGSMLLNFSDRTRTGVFNMIWPLARIQENFNILFQQHTCMYNTSQFLLCKKNCYTVAKTCKKKGGFLHFLASKV